jgi:hypothetical protein
LHRAIVPAAPRMLRSKDHLAPCLPLHLESLLTLAGKDGDYSARRRLFPNHRWMRFGTPYSGDRNPGIERSGDWLLL